MPSKLAVSGSTGGPATAPPARRSAAGRPPCTPPPPRRSPAPATARDLSPAPDGVTVDAPRSARPSTRAAPVTSGSPSAHGPHGRRLTATSSLNAITGTPSGRRAPTAAPGTGRAAPPSPGSPATPPPGQRHRGIPAASPVSALRIVPRREIHRPDSSPTSRRRRRGRPAAPRRRNAASPPSDRGAGAGPPST